MKRTHISIALAVVLATAVGCGSDSDSGEGSTAAPDTTVAASSPDTSSDTGASESSAASSEPAPSGALDVDAVLAADLDNSAPEPTGEPLKVGYAADLSDLGGFADAPASAAAEHFVNLVNCVGGVDGTPVELTIQNIEGDPEVTAQGPRRTSSTPACRPFSGRRSPTSASRCCRSRRATCPCCSFASTEPTLGDVERALLPHGLRRHGPGDRGGRVRPGPGVADGGHVLVTRPLLRVQPGGLHRGLRGRGRHDPR